MKQKLEILSVKLREATQSDANEIFDLAQDFATSFCPDKKQFSSILSKLVDDSSAYLYLAEQDGKVIGYLLGFDHETFYANGRVSWVEEIMVAEKFRGQAIGRKLMEAFELWAVKRNSRLIALATRRAAPFYQALGYQESAVYFRKIIAA